ncbi:MAG: nucleoside triphosphate pyrophosphohydrolase, partial [Candidatus Thiodiazotropha sp. (ex Notomyrtea botanica)]|nr:nucleoside triphosphate pyrophosphohydrolase [Candidatus Thiodiazotropha sp. (ex Notomyrtea botanica)]
MKNIELLLEIMSRLRDPQGGCPWDLRQTYGTIVPYTLEEAYEVADAIQRGDMAELRNELGDLLFQVVFYSQIAREEGHFDFGQVVEGICEKMLRRHPHVFSDAKFETEADLRAAWEQQKSDERADKTATEDMSEIAGVARALPALIRAEKLQKRAARVGFDWPDVDGAMNKVHEELAEIQHELEQEDLEKAQDELGDLLFSVVNVTRLLGMDAEQVLSQANEKFERRFREMEKLLKESGKADLHTLTLKEWDSAWESIKRKNKIRFLEI